MCVSMQAVILAVMKWIFKLFGQTNKNNIWHHVHQGFFSKFLMGGGARNFWSPSVPDGDEVGWGGGGTCEKNPTEAKTAQLMQN